MRIRLCDPRDVTRDPAFTGEVSFFLTWLYRWPFISPLLAVSRSVLSMECRGRVETVLEIAGDLMVSSEPIEVPPNINKYAAHLNYLICLLTASHTIAEHVHEADVVEGLGPAAKPSSSASTGSLVFYSGAHYYHTRQSLMKWNGAILSLLQYLVDLIDETYNFSDEDYQTVRADIPGADQLSAADRLEERRRYEEILEVVERLFFSRIMCYELFICCRYGSVSLLELEAELQKQGFLEGPLLLTRNLDDLNMIDALRNALEMRNQTQAWRILRNAFLRAPNGAVRPASPTLSEIGQIRKDLWHWFAFGSDDFVDVPKDIEPRILKDNHDVERWDSIKTDLRNVTEAMVGILPPEDVFNKFTAFLTTNTAKSKTTMKMPLSVVP